MSVCPMPIKDKIVIDAKTREIEWIDATGQTVKYPANPPELDGVPDMSMLIYLEEPHVVHNLK